MLNKTYDFNNFFVKIKLNAIFLAIKYRYFGNILTFRKLKVKV